MFDYNRENYYRSVLKQIIIISLLAGLAITLFYYYRTIANNEPRQPRDSIISFIFSALVTFSIFSINIQLARILEKWFPWGKEFLKRLFIEIALTTLVAAITISIILTIFLLFLGKPQGDTNLRIVFLDHIIQAILFNSIAMVIIELGVVVKQWKESVIKSERLEKENILSQFEALKHQLNPHFMFNSLNALTSLIDDEPTKAKKFISMFSKMYRYILDVKDKLVVEVNNELEFINAYIFMQKIRYNNNLSVETKVKSSELKKYLPPLSLQLLVENALKHNEISNDHPLHISICSENDGIIVKNNLKIRNNESNKSGIGLENLRKRITFISDKEPEFYTKNNQYIAKIPFIKIEE